ncbi:MAG: branched-chain amino acid ABC transporter permease [Gammaproteobacteria bacterium]|nr:branched-chain amino acid ABC transporter permease [Gammaproteobacteria bacterium]
METRAVLIKGARDIAPILVGVIPFGLIVGVTAVAIGLTAVQAVGLSVIVFAGAAQLAMIELLKTGSPTLVVIATALIINARFVMYSASLEPYFRDFSGPRRVVGAYLLTDQAFAFSINRYMDIEESPSSRFAYFLGAASTLWITWQLSTLAGALLGAGVPAAWSLDFTIPLVFVALLVPAVRDRADLIAALTAAALAIAAAGLPFNLGLLVAAVGGIAAGVIAERRIG